MLFFKRKKYILTIFLLISSFFYFRYQFINKKLKIINHIYFELPFFITKKNLCPNYQKLLKNKLNNSFSATIINDKGYIIAEHNSNKLRIPASNLKLLSTAYVLSLNNLFSNLNTSIYKDDNNNYFIYGQGDPDFSIFDLKELLNEIKFNNVINIDLFNIDKNLIWPKGWTYSDKLYHYGSPITPLALNSNEDINKDIFFIKNKIIEYLSSKYPKALINVSIKDYKKFNSNNLYLIKSIKSTPIISLITLANSESHNFTAESLFKNTSKTWDKNEYLKLNYWIKNKGIRKKGIYIADASGLSRDNRVTTNLLANFLYKMKFHKDFNFYSSSLSIMGIRGTLANRFKNTKLEEKFFGKTGTLSNVYALSGYLYKKEKSLTVSIIQNSSLIDKNIIFNLLLDIYNLKKC